MSAIPTPANLPALSNLLKQLQDLGPDTKLEAHSRGYHPDVHVTHNDVHRHLTEVQHLKVQQELELQKEEYRRLRELQARRAIHARDDGSYHDNRWISAYKHAPDAAV